MNRLCITVDEEVFKHIEVLRNGATRFRSGHINGILREAFGLDTPGKK